MFVFWEDFDESTVSGYDLSHGYGSSEPHTRIGGSYTTPGGETIQWNCETNDGLQGVFTIGEEVFNLESGCLFLVSAGREGPHVVQLKYELDNAKNVAQTLDSLAYTDPEIRNLVGRQEN